MPGLAAPAAARPAVRRSAAGGPPPAAAAGGPAASRWPSGFWLRLAFGLTCVGVTGHVLAILTRGLAEHRMPWGNMYEFIAAFTCMAVLVLVAASVRYRAYYMGLFVLAAGRVRPRHRPDVLYTPAGSAGARLCSRTGSPFT